MPSRLTLILGGARSGKSTFAERLAADHGGRVTYLATAQAFDEEMAARIAKHQADRPAGWQTCECPLNPAAAILGAAGETDCFLLDCLTLLMNNVLMANPDNPEEAAGRAIDDLLAAWRETGADLIIVSNEVGLGIVPEYPLSRAYRDILGRANQRLAAAADAVYFLIAGLPVDIKALAHSSGTAYPRDLSAISRNAGVEAR